MLFTAAFSPVAIPASKQVIFYRHESLYIALTSIDTTVIELVKPFIDGMVEKHIPRSLKDLTILLKKLKDEYPKSNVQGALLMNQTLYLSLSDSGQVWIVRDGKPNLILENENNASGNVHDNDLILIADKTLTRALSKRVIRSALKIIDIPKLLHTFKQKLKRKSVTGAFILQIKPSVESVAASSPLFKPLTLSTKIKIQLTCMGDILWSQITLKRIVIAIGISCLLLGIIFLLHQFQIAVQRQDVLKAKLSQVDHQYEEGTALIELNPMRARSLLQAARAVVEQLQGTETNSANKKILEKKLQQIEETLVVAKRQYTVSLTPFFDLTLIKNNAEGEQMAIYQDFLVVLDRKNHALYDLLLSSKSARIISGDGNVKDAIDIGIHGEDIYVLYPQGISKVQSPTGDLQPIIPKNESWKEVVSMVAFAGNLYVLDRGANQIWKYSTDTIDIKPQGYLLYDTKVDLTTANHMHIDSAVWLVDGSDIRKFTQGKESDWYVLGLETKLGQDINLFTDDLTKHIYILDTSNNRVAVFDKDGVYLAQYSWKEQEPITDFVVSEQLKKILLLSRDTIYGIELK